MTTQLDLFSKAKVELEKPEPVTTVRLGKREAKIPLRKQRMVAISRLTELLAELEGKDIYIGSLRCRGKALLAG